MIRHAGRTLEHLCDFEVSTLNRRIYELGPIPRRCAEDLGPQEAFWTAAVGTPLPDRHKLTARPLSGFLKRQWKFEI